MNQSSGTVFSELVRSNVNSVWATLLIDVLARLGIDSFVISPGSRSTPITLAAVRNPRVDAISVLDERSAGFFALGLAKRKRRPVVLVCTSGTAGANYFPAVIEASMSGTPLLVLTADRPPELRACSSGQTIDQNRLFGNYVREFYEIALPEVEPSMLRYLRQTLVHAVDRALNRNPGPVHLNLPFRDPLVPDTDCEPVIGEQVLEDLASVQTRLCESVDEGGGFDLVAVERLSSHQRGIIVVGFVNPRDGDESFTDAIAMLSQKLGWPVLADVLNPLRGHAGEFSVLACAYDCFLRDASTAKSLVPTAVLQVGPLPTSKVLRNWLSEIDAATFLLSDRPVNIDPLHRTSVPMVGEAHLLAAILPHQDSASSWMDTWSEVESKTEEAIQSKMEETETLFEGKVSALLSQHLPIGTPVMLANSMSVRYAESFWTAGSRAYSMYCNRGANGIDGTLGTALGVAHGGKPALLLTGDLAFLHDSNAMLAARQLRGSLTVVVVNNGGGGIFEFLPVARHDEAVFESFFATPQNCSLDLLCQAHGVSHHCIQNWDTFIEKIQRLPEAGLHVLELTTDRKLDRDLMQGFTKPE